MYLILAAHGQLAAAVKQSAEMVFGQMEHMTAVEFIPGENADDLKRKYREILEKQGENQETLILTDLFGGSPYNAAYETAVGKENMDVITGLCLPVLLDVVSLRTMEPELKAGDYIKRLDRGAYIRSMKQMTSQMEEEKEDEL